MCSKNFFGQVTQALEDGSVLEPIRVLDQLQRVVLFEICRDDLSHVPDPARQVWFIEDVDDGTSGISDLQPHVLMPHRRKPPTHCFVRYVGQEIVRVEECDFRRSYALGCLDYDRSKHLLRQPPVVRRGPPGEIARAPHPVSDDQRILRPCLRLLCVDRDGNVQTTSHPTQPSFFGPVCELPGSHRGGDVQLGRRVLWSDEAPPPHDCGQLRSSGSGDAPRATGVICARWSNQAATFALREANGARVSTPATTEGQ